MPRRRWPRAKLAARRSAQAPPPVAQPAEPRDDEREQLLQRPGDDGASRDAASNTAQRSLGKIIMSLVLVVFSLVLLSIGTVFAPSMTTRNPSFGGTLLQRAPLLGNGDENVTTRYVPYSVEMIPDTIARKPLTDSTFKSAIERCLEEAPEDGECVDYGSRSLYGSVSEWNVSFVTNMDKAFENHVDFNPESLSSWDVSQATSMHWMFFNCREFNGDVRTWETGKVKDMSGMFYNATKFTRKIGGWDTSSVTNMHGMFQRARRFNQALGDWYTVGVVDTAYMFEDATAFNHDITGWGSNAMFAASENMFRRAAWNAIFSRDDSSSNGPAAHWALKSQYCGEDKRVESSACVACPSGYHNAPGDDKNGGDTACGECAVDHRVSSGACVPCGRDGAYNDRRDRLADGAFAPHAARAGFPPSTVARWRVRCGRTPLSNSTRSSRRRSGCTSTRAPSATSTSSTTCSARRRSSGSASVTSTRIPLINTRARSSI